jgi:basic amino acid/polyamine antiporter, APA family
MLVSIGAICGITSVLLVTLLGQTRILFAMARDKLLPPAASKIHPKFQTPYIITIISGIVFAAIAGFVPLGEIAELANIGTLFAFILVSIGIILLRKYQPEKKASFRVPFVPLFPIISAVLCLVLMLSLPLMTWLRFVIWMGVGFAIYFMYGYKHSKLRQSDTKEEKAA